MLLRLPKVNLGDGRGNRLLPIGQETLAEMRHQPLADELLHE